MGTLDLTVFIVDDDEAVRDALAELIDSIGRQARTFSSAHAFLDAYDRHQGGCLVLDIRMPGMSGLELQRTLNQRQIDLPVIFITGHGDVPIAVDAMQRGAFDFIQKPFRDQDLLERIDRALNRFAELDRERRQQRRILALIEQLTPREKEVMEKVIAGKANKVIAVELKISQRTVEIHRARMMEKMQAATLADLISRVVKARQ
jgi:FixJ family two-component response regulator